MVPTTAPAHAVSLGGNQVDAPTSAAVNACGNTIAVLGGTAMCFRGPRGARFWLDNVNGTF
ncbi:chaplin family protein [Nocardiopsis mwathae]|uniref:chaplin family protein n=1 Tax=Nocardiopsis mwathae TaxID=1472723 RepID=UPI0031B5C572